MQKPSLIEVLVIMAGTLALISLELPFWQTLILAFCIGMATRYLGDYIRSPR